MLEDVVEILQRIEAPGSFATRRTAGAEDLHIEVKGVGRLRFPISASMARKLRAVARPASYGFRDRTLVDRNVRDCGKIAKSRIRIDQRRWKRTLSPKLEQIGRGLGIPKGSRLKAELYDMLVYGRGQFFVSHQDSEKTDDTIGTMVVTLPCASKGGATVIEHHDEKATYRSASRGLTFVAFYADCHHEVRPVTQGHRVVLTYNLRLEHDGSASAFPGALGVGDLAERIQAYFETPLRPRWDGEPPREPPDCFVYLLDHQYTQKSLGWYRLKSADAVRAAALRAAAERLDCEIALALADVHETWSCEDDHDYEYGPWQRFRDLDGVLDEEDPDDHTLVDLVDSEIELRHWVGLDGKKLLSISRPLENAEVCYTKPSVALEPFASEHEGYMGNYGNTVDRWYHRAAIVLWPRNKTFVIRAKASPSWAIRRLGKTLEKGSLDEGRSMARQLLPFWESVAGDESSRGFVEKTLRVAKDIDSPELASSLLKPFALEQLTPRTGRLWAGLLESYGRKRCQELLGHFAQNHRGPRRNEWVRVLPRFCKALCGNGNADAIALAQWLAREEWKRVSSEFTFIRRDLPGAYARNALLRLHRPILALLESAIITGDAELKRGILDFPPSSKLQAVEIDFLVRLLRAAASGRGSGWPDPLGLERLHERCTRALTDRLNDSPRAPDDWSMPGPSDCICDLCQELASFLVAGDRKRFEWPLAKAARMHVHQAIDDHDLPVTHETRRSGRPYTLVLTKTDALFERERAQRNRWKADLEWLGKQRRRFFVERSS